MNDTTDLEKYIFNPPETLTDEYLEKVFEYRGFKELAYSVCKYDYIAKDFLEDTKKLFMGLDSMEVIKFNFYQEDIFYKNEINRIFEAKRYIAIFYIFKRTLVIINEFIKDNKYKKDKSKYPTLEKSKSDELKRIEKKLKDFKEFLNTIDTTYIEHHSSYNYPLKKELCNIKKLDNTLDFMISKKEYLLKKRYLSQGKGFITRKEIKKLSNMLNDIGCKKSHIKNYIDSIERLTYKITKQAKISPDKLVNFYAIPLSLDDYLFKGN